MTNPRKDPARADVVRALAEMTNGHGIPPAHMKPVRFDPVQTAVFLLDSLLPGKPMPIMVAPGAAPIMGAMLDWAKVAEDVKRQLPEPRSPIDAHQLRVVEQIAEWQREAIAVAQAAASIRTAQTEQVAEEIVAAPAPDTSLDTVAPEDMTLPQIIRAARETLPGSERYDAVRAEAVKRGVMEP